MDHVGHVQLEEWNGRDVQELVDQVVQRTGPQTMNNTKNFIGDLIVQGNVALTG